PWACSRPLAFAGAFYRRIMVDELGGGAAVGYRGFWPSFALGLGGGSSLWLLFGLDVESIQLHGWNRWYCKRRGHNHLSRRYACCADRWPYWFGCACVAARCRNRGVPALEFSACADFHGGCRQRISRDDASSLVNPGGSGGTRAALELA